MASILDLPLETINLNILHLKNPDMPRLSSQRISLAIDQKLCPWSENEPFRSQLLTCLGQDFGIAGRDVVMLR